MNIYEFENQVKKSFPVGLSVDNPGGGTSKISGYTKDKISYIRGASRMYVALKDLYDAYSNFKGQRVTSRELKEFAPHIFDSSARPAGHSCNCTLLFLILNKLTLSSKIQGRGVRGNPFYVNIYV